MIAHIARFVNVLVITIDNTTMLTLVYEIIDSRGNKVPKERIAAGPVGGTQGGAGLSFSVWQLN